MSDKKREVLFYAHIGSVLNDEYDPSLKTQFPGSFREPGLSKSLETFRSTRGRLQNVLGGQYVTESELLQIREYSQNFQSRDSGAQNQIEQEFAIIESSNIRRRRIRQSLVYGVILLGLYVIGRNFVPQSVVDFDPVANLAHETKAFEERVERMELLSENLGDIKEYFQNHPGLGWSDNLLDFTQTHSWTPLGASVLDYEVVQISAVAYTRPLPGKDIIEQEVETQSLDTQESHIQIIRKEVARRDILVHFSFESQDDYLPTALEPTQYKSIQYYSYETDDYNIILWRHTGRYNLIIGRVAPVKMVTLIP